MRRFLMVSFFVWAVLPLARAEDLASELRAIATSGYAVPEGESAVAIADRMLQQLGSTDPELRDALIYTTFARWIRADVFTPEQLKALATTCAGEDGLTYRIDEGESDAVFKRTFAVLLLVELVRRHVQDAYLEPAEVESLKDKTLEYLKREVDLRGYVEGKGWAHAVAHSADLLDQLVRCKELDADDMQECLDVIRGTMTTTRTTYVYGEDWRMAKVVATMLREERISEEQAGAWLRRFSRDLRVPLPEPDVTRRMRRYTNGKNFLMNVHLRCLREPLPVDIADEVRNTLVRMIGSSEG